jgi:hypothetical protein
LHPRGLGGANGGLSLCSGGCRERELFVQNDGLLGLERFAQKVFLLDASGHLLGPFSQVFRVLKQALVEGG